MLFQIESFYMYAVKVNSSLELFYFKPQKAK